MQNKGNWTYEYTDENGWRFYKTYNRQNKQLSVLQLHHYTDDPSDMNHVSWEMWNSPCFCENEDHAQTLLEYYDGGILGSGFIACLTDSMDEDKKAWGEWSATNGRYYLQKDSQYA